jgi:DNA-binding response OmpR family regulator
MGRKIVLVEDDEMMIQVYTSRHVLGKYNIAIAKDGQEALEVIKNTMPELVLLDIVMPKKDGFQVLKEIKEDQILKSIPIIIFTNWDSDDRQVQVGIDMGAIEYIIKCSIEPRELVQKIDNFFSLN